MTTVKLVVVMKVPERSGRDRIVVHCSGDYRHQLVTQEGHCPIQ